MIRVSREEVTCDTCGRSESLSLAVALDWALDHESGEAVCVDCVYESYENQQGTALSDLVVADTV